MLEIKSRMNFAYQTYWLPASKEGTSVYAFQSACLQLRLAIEQVAFASLVAMRATCEEQWVAYRKENDFGRLLARLAKINPRFLPTSVKLLGRDERGMMRMIDGDVQLSRFDLEEMYGRLGNVLHARNPFKREMPLDDYRARLRENTKRLRDYLGVHAAHFPDGSVILVDMLVLRDGIRSHRLREV